MRRWPRLLDLFCKAGGTSMGYHRAGFEVIGVDIEPQPRYPFEFHRADATTFPLDGFDVVAGSPPCRDHTDLAGRHGMAGTGWMLAHTIDRFRASGLPFAVENVGRASMPTTVVLCGKMFGLGAAGRVLKRHRRFLTDVPVSTPSSCDHPRGEPVGGVYGGGHSKHANGTRFKFAAPEAAAALGIDWMTRDELSQAIPPAYTEWVGAQLIKHLAETGGHDVATLANYPRDDCSHWADGWGFCRAVRTVRYNFGRRCRLHAPGATEAHCAHRVPWSEQCRACLDIWS